MNLFPYAIGVQLFNRPEYARKLLTSLKAQTLELIQANIYILIDGYPESIYESRNLPDCTQEVERIARELFPDAIIEKFATNCGVAELHNNLEKMAFSSGGDWAAFFEEDLVLDANYLSEIMTLIAIVEQYSDVVKVGCFQILPQLAALPRGYDGFYPGFGTQAFAERRSFFLDKQPLIDIFLGLVAPHKGEENQFNNTGIAADLALLGYITPYVQHDAIVESFINSKGLLHVVSKPNLAKDIGVEGMHSYTTPEIKTVQNLDLIPESIEKRRTRFESQRNLIRAEAVLARRDRLKDIFDAFHLTKSRKRMLLSILRSKK